MRLESLRLESFRCYEKADIPFDGGINVILGPNGAGKTSLLEAMAFLSAARSPRTPRERELIRHGDDSAKIEALFESGGRGSSLEITIRRSGTRLMKADGAALRFPKELLGRLPSVFFSPGDLELLRGGAAVRRRFLDMALCQLKPRYLSLLTRYRRLIDGKTALLRQASSKPGFMAALPEYNGGIAETGAQIAQYRQKHIQALSELAAGHHRDVSGGGEDLSLEYKTAALDPEAMLESLTLRLDAELARGACLAGAHKDDMTARLNGREAGVFASQGQTRTAVISIKLAERDLFALELGEPPLLLLDDVLSELDGPRRDYLLGNITNGQVFITCCDAINGPEGVNVIRLGEREGAGACICISEGTAL